MIFLADSSSSDFSEAEKSKISTISRTGSIDDISVTSVTDESRIKEKSSAEHAENKGDEESLVKQSNVKASSSSANGSNTDKLSDDLLQAIGKRLCELKVYAPSVCAHRFSVERYFK